MIYEVLVLLPTIHSDEESNEPYPIEFINEVVAEYEAGAHATVSAELVRSRPDKKWANYRPNRNSIIGWILWAGVEVRPEKLWTACEASTRDSAYMKVRAKFPNADIIVTGAEFTTGHGDWPVFLHKSWTEDNGWS